ncbi:MAG: helix-turn-helix domain-containing protein [Lachnospiraceae bacterium]|nr:helix-turn-helix domain-containing protein [Lachnospiraceae bacterium]
MNIEIANRLVNLRKSNNYSQEALAEKLGISRQAVSKWERAEASPDTDNLILLARLYGISLDELLYTNDEIPKRDPEENNNTCYETDNDKKGNEYVNISLKGVHVIDKDGAEVRVGWDGIYIDDHKGNEKINIDKEGVFVNGVEYDGSWYKHHQKQKFPMAIIITIAYILISVFYDLWHPGWLLFLLIPLWYTLVEAIYKKNAHIFAYPVLATLIFLILGFGANAWHPGWVIYLTIPIFYSLVSYFRSGKKTGEDQDIIDVDMEKS